MTARLSLLALIAALASSVLEPPGARASTSPPLGPSSATAQVSRRIAADLALPAKDAVIFVAPLRSDEAAPRGAELAAKLAGLVAGAIGPSSSARPEPVPLSTAQALARKSKSLVYLQVEIARGQLRIAADVYRATQNLWDRARQPAPAPLAHSFASARIDAEVRGYLAPVPLLANHIDRVPTEDRDLVALACGDVEGDGSLEILTLGRRRVTLGRVRGGRFVPIKIASLRDLSGVAASPLREPVGGIALVPGQGRAEPYIDFGITDRARGGRLDPDFRVLGTIAGVPFATPSGDVCASFQGSTQAVTLAKCAEGDPAVASVDLESPLDAAAALSFVLADGTVHAMSATRDPRTAELRLRADDQATTLTHTGAQVALADLDQDGAPEIISTLDVLAKPQGTNGAAVEDAVVITSWRPGAPPRELVRTPVPGGVRAVAACPPDGAGAAPVIVATQGGELWVLR